jgi:hypothetical protein
LESRSASRPEVVVKSHYKVAAESRGLKTTVKKKLVKLFLLLMS